MKICRICNLNKPVEEFHKNSGFIRNDCKDCFKASRREFYRNNREEYFNRNYKRLYGLTLEQVEEMRKEQGNVCKICKLPEPSKRNLAIDHCHETGKVRGLLCSNCNKAVGFIRDNPEWPEKAIAYLEKYRV